MPKITELWAYVLADKDENDEGVPAMQAGGAWRPLVGADRARAESLRPAAQRIAREYDKPLKLVRSTGLEVVEVIQP